MEMALTGKGHLLMRWQCIIVETGSHMEGDMSYFDNTLHYFICVHMLHDV
jgi:hypothetical protein